MSETSVPSARVKSIARTWSLWFLESATIMFPWQSSTIPAGSPNSPRRLPDFPKILHGAFEPISGYVREARYYTEEGQTQEIAGAAETGNLKLAQSRIRAWKRWCWCCRRRRSRGRGRRCTGGTSCRRGTGTAVRRRRVKVNQGPRPGMFGGSATNICSCAMIPALSTKLLKYVETAFPATANSTTCSCCAELSPCMHAISSAWVVTFGIFSRFARGR